MLAEVFSSLPILCLVMGAMMSLKKMLLMLFLAGMLSHGGGTPRPELAMEVEEIKHLNNPVKKTIKTEDGDIFDCFEINRQPSLNHPLLKNHTIEMTPSYLPNSMNNTTSSNSSMHIKFDGCATGTVPIQRVQQNESLEETRTMHFCKIINRFCNSSLLSHVMQKKKFHLALSSLLDYFSNR